METNDATRLIKHRRLNAVRKTQWADLGCGTGFFTNVLSSFLAAGSTLYAIDTNPAALKKVKVADGITLKRQELNFVTGEWPFKKIDGIMMANSLHYVPGKNVFIEKLKHHLDTKGCVLIIEYDMSTPNAWVPYPIGYSALEILFTVAGFTNVEKIHQVLSAFGRANIYAAIAGMQAFIRS